MHAASNLSLPVSLQESTSDMSSRALWPEPEHRHGCRQRGAMELRGEACCVGECAAHPQRTTAHHDPRTAESSRSLSSTPLLSPSRSGQVPFLQASGDASRAREATSTWPKPPQNPPQLLRFCGTNPFRCVKTFLTFMQQPKPQDSHQEGEA